MGLERADQALATSLGASGTPAFFINGRRLAGAQPVEAFREVIDEALTRAQAAYHFMSGYTAKVAGTEAGVTEPKAAFSACFGAPFMPRRPEVYGNLLREKIAQHGATCWLVNTGWTGGAYGTGSRMPIRATRALLTAALDGSLVAGKFRVDENFGFEVPVAVAGVADILLDPRRTWDDAEAYDRQVAKLVAMFAENFKQYMPHIDDDVKAAAIG